MVRGRQMKGAGSAGQELKKRALSMPGLGDAAVATAGEGFAMVPRVWWVR